MMLNTDETPSKYALLSTRTLAERNSKHVSISGSSEKQAITATFGITLTNTCLPPFFKINFPDSFSLSVNPKHFNDAEESLKLLDDIIILYINTDI